jgi:hypothetical protein
MVIIVMGASRADRNRLARNIALTLDWEFADALTLHGTSTSHLDESRVTDETRVARMQALRAAVEHWIYEWQDIVVSCWVLTAEERKLLSNDTLAVDFVLMTSAECNVQPAPPVWIPNITLANSARALAPEHNKLLLVEPSRRTEEIIADVISGLVLGRLSHATC